MNEIDQLEQELSELRQRFSQSMGVLEDLAQMRSQFVKMSDDYEALRAGLEQTKTLVENVPSDGPELEKRVSQVESQLEVRYEQLQAQLTNFRFDFDATTRQLREEQSQTHDQPSQPRPTNGSSRPILGDGDRLQWVESAVQNLSSSYYSDRSNIQKLERRVNRLKRTVEIMAAAGMVGFLLIFLIYALSQQG